MEWGKQNACQMDDSLNIGGQFFPKHQMGFMRLFAKIMKEDSI